MKLNAPKLDYESPSVDELLAPDVQFKRLLPALIFVVLGLCIYVAIALSGVPGWTPARFMVYVVATATIQTAIGMVEGCRRGYFLPNNCLPTWAGGLKLAACIIFCGALAGSRFLVGFNILTLALFSAPMLVILPHLIRWVFDANTFEAIGFAVICVAVQGVIYLMLK